MKWKSLLRLMLLVLTLVALLCANCLKEISYLSFSGRSYQRPLAYAIGFTAFAGWAAYLIFKRPKKEVKLTEN